MGSDGSADQVILATAGYDHTIRFWQAHNGVCRRTVQHAESRDVIEFLTDITNDRKRKYLNGCLRLLMPQQVNALEITPDRQSIAAAGYQHIRMYELNNVNPNPIINYEGISKNVTSVGFQEDSKWMYTGGEDCTAKIWDLRSRNLQCQKIFQVLAPINCVCLHPNQCEIVIGDQSGIIHIWDLRTNRNEQLIPEADTAVQAISINSNGTYMAAVNSKGNCFIWTMIHGMSGELAQLKPKMKLQAHNKYALKCKFSPDSTYLATTSADMTVKIWKTIDFSLATELKDTNQRWVWDVAFSADSQYIITASSDNMARLWSIEQGEIKREYSGHQKAVTCLAFQDVAS